MGSLASKLREGKSIEITTSETQAGKFTTSMKVNVDFYLPELNATKIVSWKFHVDKKTNGRYDMILGRYLLTTPGLDLKFSENLIIVGEVPYEGCLAPMTYLSNYDFKSLTKK